MSLQYNTIQDDPIVTEDSLYQQGTFLHKINCAPGFSNRSVTLSRWVQDTDIRQLFKLMLLKGNY